MCSDASMKNLGLRCKCCKTATPVVLVGPYMDSSYICRYCSRYCNDGLKNPLTHIKAPYANPYGFAYFWAREKCSYSGSTYPCTFYIYICLRHGEIITETKNNLYEHYNDQY